MLEIPDDLGFPCNGICPPDPVAAAPNDGLCGSPPTSSKLLAVLGLDSRRFPAHELKDERFFKPFEAELSIESRLCLFPKNPATLGASDPLVIETAVLLVMLSFLPAA